MATRRTVGVAQKKSSASIGDYKTRVRKELEQKLGPSPAPVEFRSKAYDDLIERAYRSSVHPRAVAGLVLISSGLAPEKMPKNLGLCCGQK